jgi:hypothetical protein
MSEAALIRELEAMLNDPDYDPVAAIVHAEKERGFRVVRPGEAIWLRADDWRSESVASVNGTTIRLVLINAIQTGCGAFTRTVSAIRKIGSLPAVIEPTKEFASILTRRGWRGKQVGRTFETRETVWRPK